MKINSININNFKSIDRVNVSFVDKSIACVIGKNGSGKSNLLYAIRALKDDQYLKDENRYEKSGKEKEIKITAEIQLDENDVKLLQLYGLSLKDISRFKVTVTKKEGDNPSKIFEAINFERDFDQEVKANLQKIGSGIKKSNLLVSNEESLTLEENLPSPSEAAPETDSAPVKTKTEEETQYDNLLLKIKDFDDIANTSPIPVEEYNKKVRTYLKTVSELLVINKELSQEDKDTIGELTNETYRLATFDILDFIKNELWEKLEIVLLDLNNYRIDTSAKRTDLKNAVKHPFLFDLLRLSDKSIEDFDALQPELQNNEDDASTNLSKKLAKVWPQHIVNFRIKVTNNTDLYFSFETPQKRGRGLDDLSEGEKWFLRFYTKLAVAAQEEKQTVWLFDEPGQSLHATSQLDLKEFFEDISKTSQIIYTSHQPMMIQWHRLERIQVAENTKDQGTIITSRFWKDEELVSPLREALGLFVGEQMLTGVEHVVVEGVSDYIYLQAWLLFFQKSRSAKHWEGENASFSRTFIPAGGRDCIPLYLLFLTKRTADKISTVAIPDSKSDADRVRNQVNDFGLKILTSRIRSIGELVGNDNLKDIEDLYTSGEFLRDVKEYYQSEYPNLKIGEKFTSPDQKELVEGIIKYIERHFNELNPNYFTDKKITLDKVGVAARVYSKIIRTSERHYSKETEKNFEKIFTAVNTLFKK